MVTDQGFLKEPRVVWETLSNIDGDCHFVDETFVTVSPAANSQDPCDVPVMANLTSEQQIDQDHQLAMTLAEEDEKRFERETEWEDYKARTSAQGGAPLSE